MIIQAVGAAGYFIGRLLSKATPPFAIQWSDTLLAAFMPVCMISAVLVRTGVFSPYPLHILHWIVFLILYALTGIASFVMLRRKKV